MLRKSFRPIILLCTLIVSLLACSLFFPKPTTPATPSPSTPAVEPQSVASPTPYPEITPTPVSAWLDISTDLVDYDPTSSFTISFNQPMDPHSAQPALLTYPWTEGEQGWNSDYTQLTFAPTGGFVPARTYYVYLNRDLKSASGSSFDPAPQWELKTRAAPQIIARQPGTTGLSDRRIHIQLIFDHAMDYDSVSAELSVQPPIPLGLEWEENTLLITPGEALNPGVRYHFTLSGAAQDLDGIMLGKDYRWDYSLPELASILDGPTIDDPQNPIVIDFNYPIKETDLAGVITISTATNPLVRGDWEWVSTGRASFRPHAPFTPSTIYTLKFIADLYDTQGDVLPAAQTLNYTTPPPILNFSPRGESVDPNTAIEIAFALPMDALTTQAAFHIEPQVSGEFTWSDNTLIFQPESSLEPFTRYTVVLDEQAADAEGNPILLEPFTWSFYTEYYDTPYEGATFGEYGPNAQVLDTDGRRAIQFVAWEGLTEVNFTLYRLTLEQFLDRYSSGFKGVAGRENVAISTEGASLAKSWQQSITGVGVGWNNNIYETLIPEDVEPGLYILNLETDQNSDQLILVLTRNTLMVKQAEGQLVTWVTDINGGSRPGVRVSVYARDGELLAQGRSDENGIFTTSVPRDPQPLIVVAEDSEALSGRQVEGSDISVSGLSNEWSASFNQWWGWWQPAPQAQDYAAYIYTDRPIYRPGQTVYFKAILRQDEDAEISLPPEGTPITLRIRDARDNVVQTFDLATNAFGTVSGDFQLAEGVMLGNYRVEVDLEGENHSQLFKVQDYRKPDYQVTITTDQQQYIIGDSIQVDIDSQYFFGEPVADANLTINRYELAHTYSNWGESPTDQPDYIWYQSGDQEVVGRTDTNGHFTSSAFVADLGSYQQNYSYEWSSLQQATFGIEVNVDDGSHQTVSSFAVYTVFSSAEKLDLELDNYLQEPGEPFTVQGRVTTIADEPVSGRALNLELRQYNRQSYDYDLVRQTLPLVSDDNGEVSTPFAIERSGFYQLRLSGSDSLGNLIFISTWVYAINPRDIWASEYLEDLKISADRQSYAPGEIAQLVIESSFSGPALLSFERGTTRRVLPVELTAPISMVEIPVQPGDAPNIFVTVNAYEEQDTNLTQDTYWSLNDSRLHTASVELKVPVTDKTLTVTLTPDQDKYAPRDQATFTIQVSDEQGQPVVAELSLALVDEAIFSLSKELSGPIVDAFYFDRQDIVRTYHSMALQRELLAPGRGGGGGDGLAGNPRSDFRDTAEWLPVVYTDANGEAIVTFTLPDNLTTWRLTAKAVTADSMVGEAHTKITTQQAVVIRPILPRTLTAGDRVLLSAMLHNYSDASQELDVVMLADPADPASSFLPLMVADPLTQTIRLEPGEVHILGWTAEALGAGEAAITVQAFPSSTGVEASTDSDEVSDSVRLTVPIRPLAVPDVVSQVGEFEGDFSTTLMVPEGVLDISAIKLELSRSIAGSLLTGLEYLTGYPYGCVEQTMSKALPNAVVGRAFYQLGVGNPTLQADLPPKINAGLQRLYGYQHNDGGWGWWFDDQTHDYQTAWVVFGLALTDQAGYEVDHQVIARGTEWLVSNLEGMDLRTRAFALYSLALAGYADPATGTEPILSAALELAEQVHELDAFSQAGLALALHDLGAEAEANAILDMLAESAVQRDGMVYWPNPHEDGHYYDKTMASTVRTTALALEAFVRLSADHPFEAGIVRWLMSQRRQDGWGSTNETSFTILALTDHLLTLEEATADSEYRLDLNGQTLASGVLGREEPAISLEIPVIQMETGPNTLEIHQSAGGRLYYVFNSRMYFPKAEIEAAGGVEVTRRYLDPDSRSEIDKVVAGQLVRVELQANLPDNAFFIIVEDKLPGGLEALNESLNITSHEQTAYQEEPNYYWQEYGYNNKEVYGDRVSFFISEMERGPHTFSYMARASRPGSFVALPAEVSAMYDLSVWGRSNSAQFNVTEE